MKSSRLFALAGLSAVAVSSAFSDLYTHTVTLNGTTQFDGWDGNGFAANGVNYPGTSPWPGPIVSNVAGSGDAGLFKVANGTGGGPYPTGSAGLRNIYHGGTSATPNTLGGTLKVGDSTLVAGIQTVVFQIIIGEAYGYDFFNHEAPVLTVNGETTSHTATFTHLLAQEQNGTFPVPGGGTEPLYDNLWGLQWDLAGLGDVTSLEITWSSVQHARIKGLQLDQSNQFQGDYFASVPEPGTMAALGLGAAALLRRRKKA